MQMLPILLLTTVSTFDPGGLPTWAEFAISPDRPGFSTTVEIGTVPGQTDETEHVYWLRLIEVDNGLETIRYTDTRNCQAANTVIARMEQFAVPSGSPPHRSPRGPITVGSARISLRMPVLFGDRRGEVSLSSNTATPLAEFVTESLDALEPCWSADLPPAR